MRSLPNLTTGEHTALFDDDPDATNTADLPDRVTPTRLADVKATAAAGAANGGEQYTPHTPPGHP